VVELATGTAGALVTRVMNLELEAVLCPSRLLHRVSRRARCSRSSLSSPHVNRYARCRTLGDIGRSTLIAFAQRCSYRKRVDEWLGSANVISARIIECSSYQAMIACVAAGSGFAVVPKSVLEALRASRSVRQHPLPRRFAHNRTFIAWNGQASPSLNGLLGDGCRMDRPIGLLSNRRRAAVPWF
jgi:DNA-binding transcriptional LysR family regulator